ncbi:MAG: TIGR04283 family arsenosugar biosynthesis glycosyltransferase [Proteobacteria bacterium]|nr:TIGR04283 family arsenosugar biosynthesis glycosyltransferase [Pseudomonadota bacterium]
MVSEGLSVSVVIPTLNEGRTISRALGCTRLPGVERIVVDGGSSDGTVERARELASDLILQSEPGRAVQMQVGFRAASGDALLFLHSDTRLDPGWRDALVGALADPRVSGGAFRLQFESPGRIYRILETGVDLRVRMLGLPYGDQALFVRRECLEAAGGIPPVPIFEDLDLARLIRSRGRLARLRTGAWTSPRRYQRNGPLRQVGRNLLALSGYALGADRERVARWYHGRPAR